MFLAIDTSTKQIGICIYDGSEVLFQNYWQAGRYHTTELSAAVDDAFVKTRISKQELKGIVVASGPGSFTGLRIGMAFAKGMCLAMNLPLIPVPTLDIVAAAQPVQDMPLVVFLQAGRKRVAFRYYKVVDGEWISEEDYQIGEPHELSEQITKRTLIAGEINADIHKTLARKHKNAIIASPAASVRNPAFLAELGYKKYIAAADDVSEIYAPEKNNSHLSSCRANTAIMSTFYIRKMTMDDLDEVIRIDHSSFTLPWSSNNFVFELTENQMARCYVACFNAEGQEIIVGLLVIWLIVDVAHIATISVDENYRRKKVAERLLLKALKECADEGAVEATLEVRVTNLCAQALYKKLGFEIITERPNYYSDTKEGALIMTLHDIHTLIIR